MVPHGHTGQANPTRLWAHESTEATITRRTALVGGGAAGIGYAIAARLAPTHRVVITGRSAGPLHTAARRLRDRTGAAVGTLIGDIAAPDSAAPRLRCGLQPYPMCEQDP